MIKTKWFMYTVLVGLVPFLVRSLISFFDTTASAGFWLNPIDFVVLGLVVNLANINQLEDKEFEDRIWKTFSISFSLFQLIIFAVLLAYVYSSELQNADTISMTRVLISSIVLSIAAVYFSFRVHNKLSKLLE